MVMAGDSVIISYLLGNRTQTTNAEMIHVTLKTEVLL